MDANSSFSIVQGEENTLEYTLSIGEYDWNITCMDDDGDTNTSETRTLIIEQPTHTGNAVLFNGTDTYATFGKTTYEATMTFSVWIKLNGTGKTQEIVQAQGSSKAVFFRVSGTEQIYFRKEGTTVDFTCDTVLDTGEWYHVVGIFDGSNGGKVYLNGELDGQDTGTITLTTGYSRSEIGQHNWGIERFDGLMDQLLIFNRAISEAEVLQLYNSGDGLYADVTVAPFNSGLVVGYNFDESSGSTLSDLTGTYNATLYNGTFVPGKSFAISST